MPHKYRKKPVVIEAAKLIPDNADKVAEWCNGSLLSPNKGISIVTLEGTMLAEYGDYIIKGVQGEFYPCKPDIFMATYERVDY